MDFSQCEKLATFNNSAFYEQPPPPRNPPPPRYLQIWTRSQPNFWGWFELFYSVDYPTELKHFFCAKVLTVWYCSWYRISLQVQFHRLLHFGICSCDPGGNRSLKCIKRVRKDVLNWSELFVALSSHMYKVPMSELTGLSSVSGEIRNGEKFVMNKWPLCSLSCPSRATC